MRIRRVRRRLYIQSCLSLTYFNLYCYSTGNKWSLWNIDTITEMHCWLTMERVTGQSKERLSRVKKWKAAHCCTFNLLSSNMKTRYQGCLNFCTKVRVWSALGALRSFLATVLLSDAFCFSELPVIMLWNIVFIRRRYENAVSIRHRPTQTRA